MSTGSVLSECSDCHSTKSWKPAEKFDHGSVLSFDRKASTTLNAGNAIRQHSKTSLLKIGL